MTKGSRLGAAVLLVLVLAAGMRVAHHFNTPRPLHPGDRLSPISLLSLTGQNVTLKPAGRPQVINVFATWCMPCRMETPQLAVLAKALQARGVDVVGIDQQEAAAQVDRFRTDFSLRYPLYIDGGNLTHTVLGARVIPETLYVDAGGIIRWVHEGPLSDREFRSIGESDGRTV